MAETTPSWEEDYEAWDTLILGTNVMPGVWDIEDGNVKRVLDVKKAPGRDGATIKDQGYENGALVCRGQMLAEHWETMQRIAGTLKLATKGKSRTPIAISHPKALYLGITRVYVTEIEVPRIDNGICTCAIRVLEYLDKPKGAGGPKKPKVSLEVELARKDAAVWMQPHMTDENIRDQNAALEGMKERDVAGKTPKYKGQKPQYAPAP